MTEPYLNTLNPEQRRAVEYSVDDPEGVERCRRENPNALIIHHVIVQHRTVWPLLPSTE
jgi:hypothetical protein